jgi:hypothetical protein
MSVVVALFCPLEGGHAVLLILRLLFAMGFLHLLFGEGGEEDVVGADVTDDLAEVTADEAPARVVRELFRDLAFVAEHHHLCAYLRLSQEAVEEQSVVEVADDDWGDEGERLAVGRDAGVALEADAVALQLLLDLLELRTAVVLVDDVHHSRRGALH